jgi:hypothetical protein
MVMGMREKLIELIVQSGHVSGFVRGLADHLIANGVRLEENQATSDEIKQYVPDTNVGKWIPVGERLPELNTKVLCCGIKGGRFIAELTTWGIEKHLTWDKRDGKGCPTVTHWMPLPEPPTR